MHLWENRIERSRGPLYLAIADAIESAIGARELCPGDRLPPHRELAVILKIDPTTVTRGYAEARRRGMIDAAAGRGSFVRGGVWTTDFSGELSSVVDLSMNLPPLPVDPSLRDMLREGLDGLLSQADLANLMTYHVGAGSPRDRDAGATWLRPLLGEIDPARVLVCAGAQCGFTALLTLLTKPGDTLLTGALTYPRFRAAATQFGVRVVPVAMDHDGFVPKELDAACRAFSPKAIYGIPTIHNPTTMTMSAERRQAIAEVVLRHRVPLIEDDAYGKLPSHPHPAIATMVPELTYYIGTISKCLTPGLRIAYLVAPGKPQAERLEAAIRATSLMPSPLMSALVSGWIHQGAADALCQGVRAAIVARQAIARELLPAGSFAADPEGPHLWLTLPPSWHRVAFIAYVRGMGLALSPSDSFTVAETPPNAVRIGLGAAESDARVRSALASIATVLRSETPEELRETV